MKGLGNRIKSLRKLEGLTQEEFGARLGVGRGAITNLEFEKVEPKNNFLSLICREFRVNERWLRTGEGEMYIADSQAEIMDFIGQLMHDNEDSFKQRFIATLAKLREDDWKVLERIANELAKKEGDA